MSPTSECLAGLDAMVLDINRISQSHSHNVSASTLDDSSWDIVPRVMRKGKRRAVRAPLGDKTREFNIKKHIPLSTTLPRCERTFTIYRDEPDEYIQSPHSPIGRTSTSFHPLTLVTPISSLQFPSFRDFSLNSITPSQKPICAPSDQELFTQIPATQLSKLDRKENRTGNESDIHAELYRIPAFQHPNSPYIPWTPPTRHQILCPPTPAFIVESTTYSRPYSRSGARAPEPCEDAAEQLPVSRSWKDIRRAFTKSVQQVTKRLVKSFKLDKTAAAIRAHHASNDPVHMDECLSLSLPQRDTSLLSPPSFASMKSTDTNSLAVWLAARQREGMEGGNEPNSLMTLEEYECMGSWIDVGMAAQGTWSCGVPQCKIHLAKTVMRSDEEMGSNERSGVTATAMLPFSPVTTSSPSYISSPSHSMPQLPSLTSRWFESVEQLVQEGTCSGTSWKTDRHKSMPGGWTFPL